MHTVVKVGGSLFTMPDLGPRLAAFLGAVPRPVVLVPGGGPAVDVLRSLDRTHGLGEAAAHWLALRLLTVNAHFLRALLRTDRPVLAGTVRELTAPGREGTLVVLDGSRFAEEDETRADPLPCGWEVTSDSLAARVAMVLAAPRLVLLKAADLPEGLDFTAAAGRGLVDPYFATVLAGAGPGRAPRVEWVNFRTWACSNPP